MSEECSESVSVMREEHDDHVQRKLMLICREKELLEREQQLLYHMKEAYSILDLIRLLYSMVNKKLRREREMTCSVSATNSVLSAAGGVRNLSERDLLPELDAIDNTF